MELQPCRPPAGTDTESGASQAGRQAKEETNQERPFKSSPTPTPVHPGSSGAGLEPLPTLPEHQPSAGLQQQSANYLLKLMWRVLTQHVTQLQPAGRIQTKNLNIYEELLNLITWIINKSLFRYQSN